MYFFPPVVDKASPHTVKRENDISLVYCPHSRLAVTPANLKLGRWMHLLLPAGFCSICSSVRCNPPSISTCACLLYTASLASGSVHAAVSKTTWNNIHDFLVTFIFFWQLEVLLSIKIATPASSGGSTGRKLSCATTPPLFVATQNICVFNHASLHLSIF